MAHEMALGFLGDILAIAKEIEDSKYVEIIGLLPPITDGEVKVGEANAVELACYVFILTETAKLVAQHPGQELLTDDLPQISGEIVLVLERATVATKIADQLIRDRLGLSGTTFELRSDRSIVKTSTKESDKLVAMFRRRFLESEPTTDVIVPSCGHTPNRDGGKNSMGPSDDKW